MVKAILSKRLTPFNPSWNSGIMESWNGGDSGFQSNLKWCFPNYYPVFQSSNIPVCKGPLIIKQDRKRQKSYPCIASLLELCGVQIILQFFFTADGNDVDPLAKILEAGDNISKYFSAGL